MSRSGLLAPLTLTLALGACTPTPNPVAPGTHAGPPRRCAGQPAPAVPVQAPAASPAPPLSPCPSCAPPPAPELPAPTGTIVVTAGERPIRVHFSGADEPYRDCQAHAWVVRTVPAGVDPVAFAVRAVITGPTKFEAAQGLHTPFAAASSDPGIAPLSASGVRVKVKDGVATVDFPTSARPYLDQAACARTAVASSI
ncbi:MAG TPA: hypothetical protein VGB85_23555, partial [Nannocystis sp.]